MKLINVLILASALFFLFTTSSFADFAQTGEETITCGSSVAFDIGLSPGVTAGYSVGDWKGSDDWYVVGTYHKGGNKVYATASSLTKIWNNESSPDELVTALFDTVPQTPETAASDDQWSAGGWDI